MKINAPLLLGIVACSAPAWAQPAAESWDAFRVSASSGLNVRSEPSASGTRVGALAAGAAVQVKGVSGDWARIEFNGAERWVHRGYLRAPEARALELSGRDSRRGESQIRLELRVLEDGEVELVRRATYANGPEEFHRGRGRVVAGELHTTLAEFAGAVGALTGTDPSGGVEVWLRLRGGVAELRDRSARGEGQARAEAPSSSQGGLVQRGRHLLALADREIRARIRREGTRLAYDGVALEREFALSRFAHVGVGGAIEALRPTELSPGQVETTREKPGHVWLQSKVHGGVRLPLSTSIPVGEFTLGLGFETGARVDYTVVDIYPLPTGVSDVSTVLADLRQVASRSFDLPLDASEARAMTVGARRVFEGRAHVAVNGNLSIGREVADVRDVLRIGASARAGGFYKISGRARIEVERLPRGRARVRLSRGKTQERGVSADLFLGASLDRAGVKEELAPAVEYLDEALIDYTKLPSELRTRLLDAAQDAAIDRVNGVVKRALRFQIRASATNTHDDELDLAYRFDLERGPAREAYERAVRGDFTLAGRRALDPASGVSLDHRVVDVERITHLAASLELSVFLSASASRKISLQDLSVRDASGRTDYEVWRFEREFRLALFDLDRRKKVDLEVIRRTRPGEGAQSSLRFRLDVTDPITRQSEAESFQRLLRWWGLDSSSNLPVPGDRGLLASRYGETRTQVEVQLDDRGIEHILRHTRDDYLNAYAQAYAVIEGRTPLWASAEGRARIDRAEHDDNDNYRFERQQLERARHFAHYLQQLGRAGDAAERAQALKWLASTARYDLYSMAALVALAPRSSLSIDASLMGERIRVVDGVRGATALRVEDPR